MMMTLRRLKPLIVRAQDPSRTPEDLKRLGVAIAQRLSQRGPSKLARRLSPKAQLGRAGAF